MPEMVAEEGACLLDDGQDGSFAFRVALMLGIQGLDVAHEPGSRADFLQALQQLGAEPKICRLRHGRSVRQAVKVHVSCSREAWTSVFGEPECIEEMPASKSEHTAYRWRHFCSDGLITCIGHLFQQSPDVAWVVVVRIMVL